MPLSEARLWPAGHDVAGRAGLFHDREEFTTAWSIKVFAIMVRARNV
jgi:hypothetical protein